MESFTELQTVVALVTDNTQHVSGQLLDSSRQFAQSALRALPQGDFALFALHAGTALEHLSKAVLAQRHLALIAAADFDSLLHACEEESAAQAPAMRTISVTESIKRATRFVPGLAAHRVPLAVLF